MQRIIPPKKNAQAQARRKLPAFKIELVKSKGAPAKPTAMDLANAFGRAWRLIPAARAPLAFEQTRVSVNVLLVDDAEIAVQNEAHMRHSGATDVLSFPMGEFDPERGTFHLGDILASFQTAQREAAARGITLAEELTRYCIHGFLHCMGYDDSTPAKRKAMFAVQEKAVAIDAHHSISRKGAVAQRR
jgi:probable rRNA maturation factor